MAWTQQEINDCINSCKQRAATDAEFRGKLLADPAAAIREVSGKEIPAGFRIKVLESDPAYDATFVLPPAASGNVSDKELDGVTGGSLLCAFETCAANACGADK